ncbi:MAG TPA: cytochrome c [Terriglobales bacterium]|nr:cytochrome c [Terriglobales bacterium]
MKHSLAIAALFPVTILVGCQVSTPGSLESKVAKEVKQVTIGGKDWKNPVPDTKEAAAEGGTHFQHHCQICHGLDGQKTGVPFAEKMDPPVPDLTHKDVQEYTDGQLKWIIENGIAPSGMPAWKGILTDDEMWKMVLYIRHLPPKGSLGAPAIYKEEAEEHEHAKEEAGETHVHKDGQEHKH